MQVLVTGAKGMLGNDLVKLAELEGLEVIETDIEELDITDYASVHNFIREEKPDIVINCAAYTQVDRAEQEREKAFLINAEGAKNIALVCKEFDVIMCHISTDYVFDGEKRSPYLPEDKPNPINVYGASKYEGEKHLISICDKYYIIRTSWLYGRKGNNFVYTILKLAKEKNELRVVSDQIGSPTWTGTLSEAIIKIIKNSEFGIYHVTDRTEMGISWYDFAREIVRLSNMNVQIIPIQTKDYPTAAKRPLYSVLDIGKASRLMGDRMPFWQDSLRKFLHEVNFGEFNK